jgi:hypothetical protein
MIADPVAGRSYALDPGNHTGRVAVYAAPEAPKITPVIGMVRDLLQKNEPEIKKGAKPPAKAAPPRLAAEPAPPKEPLDERTKRESLGKRLIEGVEVEGTRTTRTIPAGEVGNTRPLQIVDESWYSPELHLRIMIMHRDPRSGESTFRLTNINRGEPARTLFEVPPNYRLAGNLAIP